jgi:hypothetical protein
MLRAHPDAGHARVAIRIAEIDIPGHKNVLIIRAPGRQDQGGENQNLNRTPRPGASPLKCEGIALLRIKMTSGKFAARTGLQISLESPCFCC